MCDINELDVYAHWKTEICPEMPPVVEDKQINVSTVFLSAYFYFVLCLLEVVFFFFKNSFQHLE